MTTLPSFNEDLAGQYTETALENVKREFPNLMGHVMNNANDVVSPRQLHPIFFGSFDWHSSVHSWWMLCRILRLYPDSDVSSRIVDAFRETFTLSNIDTESAYLNSPERRSFSRPYGRSWLVKLADEMAQTAALSEQPFVKPLKKVAKRVQADLLDYFANCTYPVRSGVHSNTALPLILLILTARRNDDAKTLSSCRQHLVSWHYEDAACQAWEPSQNDFLSPALSVAAAMSCILGKDEFASWLKRFLPGINVLEPRHLFEPATVTDRQDYHIVHLDGVNLSRAWFLRMIIKKLDTDDPAAEILTPIVAKHVSATLPYIQASYAGSHWLMTYATLALTPLD